MGTERHIFEFHLVVSELDKMSITSAAGIISLLEEPRQELKVFALKKLDDMVDEFWPEISESIEKIEMLHEDRVFTENKVAGLVASKVFYI